MERNDNEKERKSPGGEEQRVMTDEEKGEVGSCGAESDDEP